MDLFTPAVNEKDFHPNFRNILRAELCKERKELQRWASDFPDRDGKFVKEFQTTFNPCFWELYLNALFKDLGFDLDWEFPSPDFLVRKNGIQFSIEAATAGAASGKTPEWEKTISKPEEIENISLNALNRESIIRLSNTFFSKLKKYRDSYSKASHVKNRPFVIAIAPFEQPHFNLQYNRPITALLYDYYVDEEAYLANPEDYPSGPPARQLGSVEKDNGSEIELGVFSDSLCSEISAVIFSCTATWGKVDALTTNSNVRRVISSIRGEPPHGAPKLFTCSGSESTETIQDGLQVYHNPYAVNPIDPEYFRADGVVQVFGDKATASLITEGEESCLMHRQVYNLIPENK
ncbi:MAG: hypothetical protein R3F50_20350 [Gammaproteobacteria bacterium]